ncbi:hypothetical protein QYF36_021881 [Acer negundo]|nr:hypothetical protein QYF36_021881 [Acer negundo]
MESKSNPLSRIGFPFTPSHQLLNLSKIRFRNHWLLCITIRTATCSTKCQAEVLTSAVAEEPVESEANNNSRPKEDSIQIFKKWGCNENDISKLFSRRPSLSNADLVQLQSNLSLLSGLGLTSSDLVRGRSVGPFRELLANIVLKYPFLLFNNLEAAMKPRLVLAGKIQDMGLSPEIKGRAAILRALRMAEKRFLKAYVSCHPQDVADELMEVYRNAKCI